ncbi:hypothetical protein M0R04_15945 [Candidatus Dojkabacteria bacterium]|jgi:hypothetical protein|nr:hypothetical protein [Candidatus Dojkabacteria bacterium]
MAQRKGEEEKREILDFSKTHTYAEVTEKYGICQMTLATWRKDAGISGRSIKDIPDPEVLKKVETNLISDLQVSIDEKPVSVPSIFITGESIQVPVSETMAPVISEGIIEVISNTIETIPEVSTEPIIKFCSKLVDCNGLCLFSDRVGFLRCITKEGVIGKDTTCDKYDPKWDTLDEVKEYLKDKPTPQPHKIVRGEITGLIEYFKMYFGELAYSKREEVVEALRLIHGKCTQERDAKFKNAQNPTKLLCLYSDPRICRKKIRQCSGIEDACPLYIPVFKNWEEVMLAMMERTRNPKATEEDIKRLIDIHRSRVTSNSLTQAEITGAFVGSRLMGVQ